MSRLLVIMLGLAEPVCDDHGSLELLFKRIESEVSPYLLELTPSPRKSQVGQTF